MIASRVTPPATEVEGAEEDEAEDGGVAGATRLDVSMRGCFD